MLFVYNALLVAEHRSLMSARQLVCPSGHTGSQRDNIIRSLQLTLLCWRGGIPTHTQYHILTPSSYLLLLLLFNHSSRLSMAFIGYWSQPTTDQQPTRLISCDHIVCHSL